MTRESAGLSSPIMAVLQEALVRHGGAIPFVMAMDLLLYHPRNGYYMGERARIGRQGDFVTAPEMTSLFGELLALQFAEVWHHLGQPKRFQVLETGAGSGRLALDVLNTAKQLDGFGAALEYHILEISHDFRQRQQALLASHQVSWFANVAEVAAAGGVTGVIFGNEVLDAFPVHWVVMTESGLRELWVTMGPDGLTTQIGDVSPPLTSDYFEKLAISLPVGYRTEVGLAGAAWTRQLAGCLQDGLLLMVDYGYPRHELYHEQRMDGTLMGFHRNQSVADPLAWPGEMDITSHVDFTAIAQAGQEGGLALIGFTSQSWFLMGLGLLERLAQQETLLPPESLATLRQAVMRLVMPGGMGERFQVLALGRGLPDTAVFSGFRLKNRLDRLAKKY